jgi:hypothetical protein
MAILKRIAAVAAAVALTFAAVPGQASTGVNTKFVEGTDPAAAMFNPMVVNEFNITMPQSTIKGLDGTTNYWGDEGPYLPCTLSGKINGVAFGPYQVGVHLKGAWGSWRNIYGKAGLKIKVDFNNKNQTLFGVRKLTLNNMVQDQSSLHETMSYRLFRSVGVATARTGYVNVTLNGQNYGLRLNLETFDTTLLKRWGVTPSHIYKGGVPIFPEFWPGQENNFVVDQGSLTDKSDLTALLAVVGRGNGPKWFNDMSAIADLEQMTLNWAAEKFTGHWDGYVNNRNNFYLVKRQDGKFTMHPWGMDQTWNGGLDYWSGNALISQCLADAQCLTLYKRAIATVAHAAQDLDLPNMSREVATVINPFLLADPKKEFGNDQIPGNQVWSRNFITGQISQALSLIQDHDTYLRNFGASGLVPVKPKETLVVPNSVKSIQLTGSPYSSNSFATAQIANLAPGMNMVKMTVTNRRSNTSQDYTLKVQRLALATKVSTITFAPDKYTLTSVATKTVAAAAKAIGNGKFTELTIRMARPANMSVAKSASLLRLRAARIEKAYQAAGLNIEKLKLVIGPVKGKDAVTLTVNYQR